MAEMEKEGRPPENKRSRKPAHPVKREINEEMKSFAESTMNELLGWYGYDKVELRDSDSLEIGETPQHISVLKENLLPKIPPPSERRDGSPDRVSSSVSLPASRNGITESSNAASTSMSGSKEHGNLPMVMPMIPPPLIKPPADDDASNVQIMCAWCQKVGVKRYSLSMGSELKSFCSEKCFAACRRAYFKRNKARDDDGLGGKLRQHSFTQDTARLVYKANSDVLVCDWCKHIRHTKEYLDFGAGERRLQFCSAKCLNQYKMDIFYKETQAALPGALCNPGHGPGGESKLDCGGGVQLLTPESWGSPVADLRRKIPSPGGPSCTSALAPSTSSATSPSDTAAICSPSSSSSAKIPTPRPHESSTHPPPPLPSMHPPVGVPSGSPPMVMTPRGPMPLPLFMEHQMMQQMRPPFLRPSPHPAGASSPLSNPMIPGIGPPPPPRTIGPGSSPMHRPLLSPHIHPSSGANPGMMPPHPGMPMPGLPPFPPVNMIPNGRIPLPPVMNFGMPSLAPLVPPPTLLVPYPVIVPLPVPIPIPIPIPFSPEASRDQKSGSAHRAPPSSEGSASGPHSPNVSGGSRGDQRVELTGTEPHSPFISERSGTASVDLNVKAEDNLRHLSLASGLMDGVIDLTVSQRTCQQLSIQKTQPGIKVKVEAGGEAGSPSDAGPDWEGRGTHTGEGGSIAQELLSVSDLEGLTYPNIVEPLGPPTSKSSPSFNSDPLIKPLSNVTPTSQCSTERTLPQSLPQLQSSPAAACNVIVNGSGWPPLVPSPVESCPNRKGDHSTGDVEPREPINGDLENEALKENNCSNEGKRVTVQEESPDGFECKPDPDSSLEEGEHAYSIPLLSTGGCVVIQPVPKPGADKTAILSCSISAPLSTAVSPELEPPLKRRCLRIRNQNK